MQGEATIHIKAPPEAVYALVSDITRMGEWSPECVGAEWVDGATGPTVGAKFKGHNRIGRFLKWTTNVEVSAAEPGREFAFATKDTTWRYRLEPLDGGTSLTESFDTPGYGGISKLVAPEKKRQPTMVEGMNHTLQRIKAAAETTTS